MTHGLLERRQGPDERTQGNLDVMGVGPHHVQDIGDCLEAGVNFVVVPYKGKPTKISRSRFPAYEGECRCRRLKDHPGDHICITHLDWVNGCPWPSRKAVRANLAEAFKLPLEGLDAWLGREGASPPPGPSPPPAV